MGSSNSKPDLSFDSSQVYVPISGYLSMEDRTTRLWHTRFYVMVVGEKMHDEDMITYQSEPGGCRLLCFPSMSCNTLLEQHTIPLHAGYCREVDWKEPYGDGINGEGGGGNIGDEEEEDEEDEGVEGDEEENAHPNHSQLSNHRPPDRF